MPVQGIHHLTGRYGTDGPGGAAGRQHTGNGEGAFRDGCSEQRQCDIEQPVAHRGNCRRPHHPPETRAERAPVGGKHAQEANKLFERAGGGRPDQAISFVSCTASQTGSR
jgi:hypothetical protein